MTTDNAPHKTHLRDLQDIAARAAWKQIGAKSLPSHMHDDLKQEGTLWLLEHPNRVEYANLGSELYQRQLVSQIRKHLRATGADRPPGEIIGNVVIDRDKYTPGMVAKVFPAVFDPGFQPWEDRGVIVTPEQLEDTDPEASRNWFAMVADVDRAVTAYGRYTGGIRYLFRHIVLGDTYRNIGEEERVSHVTARTRVTDALEWLTDWLNGLDPNRDKRSEMASKYDIWDHVRSASGPDTAYEEH